MRLLTLYQYLAPLLLFPTAYYLWLEAADGNHRLALFVLAIPVVWAYVIPGIGTNRLGLWEFHTRLRLGKFRPHHGFVFGTATGLFALVTLGGSAPELNVGSLLQAGFLLGSVLALWNWIYDILAIRAGLITVYNRAYAAGKPPEVIAAEYAPVLFGTFGLCYGVAVRLGQGWLSPSASWLESAWLLLVCTLATIALPVLAYMVMAYVRYGDWGLRAYSQTKEEVT